MHVYLKVLAFLYRSLVEEMRKVSCALWQEEGVAHSPDSLFSVVWKLVPRFRWVPVPRLLQDLLMLRPQESPQIAGKNGFYWSGVRMQWIPLLTLYQPMTRMSHGCALLP